MKLSKAKAKTKTKKSKDADVDVIEQPSVDEKVRELEEALAVAENRIRTLSDEVDTRADKLVQEKLQRTYDGFANFLAAAEQRILGRIVEFLNSSPGWETKQVSKTSIGSEFYDPAKYFDQLLRQGWRWVGNGFNNKERYDLFIKPKSLPMEKKAFLEMFEDFQKKRAVELSRKQEADAPVPKLKLLRKPKTK